MSRDEGFKKVTETLTINVVTTILILMFSAAIGQISSVILGSKSTFLGANQIPIGIAVFALVSLTGVYAWRRVDRLRAHFPRLHPSYEVLSKTIEYRFIDRRSIRYTKKLEIKARNHGLNVFVDKYNWSGKGSIVLSTMIPEHKIVELGTRNIWNIYEVSFGKTLRKGHTTAIAVRWDLVATEKPARPFISQTIECPTKVLTMKLRVPESFGITTARKIIRPTIDTIDEFEYESCEVEDGYLEWVIKRPRLFYCYELAWEDPGMDLTPPQEADLATPRQ